MCKFVAITARNLSVGSNGISYRIHDKVTFDPKKDIESQMRKYSYRYFYNIGKNPKKFRKEVFCRRRHIIDGKGSVFAEKIKIFEHSGSNDLIGFIPRECFDF